MLHIFTCWVYIVNFYGSAFRGEPTTWIVYAMTLPVLDLIFILYTTI
jgi:hypothetical protein